MTENELKNLLAAVTPPDEAARAAAHAHWADWVGWKAWSRMPPR